MIYNLQIRIEDNNYLDASARLRGISRKLLIEKTLRTVIRDQMFLAILDDEGKVSKPEHRTRVPRAA